MNEGLAGAAMFADGAGSAALAVEDPPQTRGFDELKAETQARADRQAYPLTGLDPADVRGALATLHGWNRDAWAAAFIAVGDRYDACARGEGNDPAARRADTRTAWRWYAFARWPVANSAQKHLAHAKAKAAFARYAAMVSPGIEAVEIPFEGKVIHAHLQLPPGAGPAPLVMSIGGVDSWRDVVAMANRPFVDAGMGSLALDMPGTADAAMRNEPGAERLFSAVLDWVATRPDIDARRVVVRGQSWGGYWAARVAYHEAARLCGAVDQGGPAAGYFSRAWQEQSLKSKEYLFDFVQSRLFIWGQPSVEVALDWLPGMSLEQGGLIDKKTPPMLVINGVRDTQTPIGDLWLVLSHGSAKDAWVNPQGGHMGRGPGMNDQQIFRGVVLPWIARHLDVPLPAAEDAISSTRG
jgi:esterase FrsA